MSGGFKLFRLTLIFLFSSFVQYQVWAHGSMMKRKGQRAHDHRINLPLIQSPVFVRAKGVRVCKPLGEQDRGDA